MIKMNYPCILYSLKLFTFSLNDLGRLMRYGLSGHSVLFRRCLGVTCTCCMPAADARIRLSVERVGPQRGVATLSLREATGGDTGCYTLILTNPLGTDRLAASVTVEGRHPNYGTYKLRVLLVFHFKYFSLHSVACV